MARILRHERQDKSFSFYRDAMAILGCVHGVGGKVSMNCQWNFKRLALTVNVFILVVYRLSKSPNCYKTLRLVGLLGIKDIRHVPQRSRSICDGIGRTRVNCGELTLQPRIFPVAIAGRPRPTQLRTTRSPRRVSPVINTSHRYSPCGEIHRMNLQTLIPYEKPSSIIPAFRDISQQADIHGRSGGILALVR